MKKVFLIITAILIFSIIGFAFYISRPVKKDAPLKTKPKAKTRVEKTIKPAPKPRTPLKPRIEEKPEEEPPEVKKVHKEHSESDKKKLEDLLKEDN